jgi:hypothetical protein
MDIVHWFIHICISKGTYEYQQNLYYIDTFGLLEGADARMITIQCEQYSATIHLFIGTGRCQSKSTFMTFNICS